MGNQREREREAFLCKRLPRVPKGCVNQKRFLIKIDELLEMPKDNWKNQRNIDNAPA